MALTFAPLGGAHDDPLTCIEHGDIPGIAAMLIDGEVRALRSRNTPAPDGVCRIPNDTGGVRMSVAPIEERGELVTDVEVPAREARVVEVKRGQVLQIVDLEGQQVGDLMAYRPSDPDEYLSPAHTLSCLVKLMPEVGDELFSNLRTPLLRITRDDVGTHDMIVPCCDQQRYARDYDQPDHPSCLGSLETALARLRLRVRGPRRVGLERLHEQQARGRADRHVRARARRRRVHRPRRARGPGRRPLGVPPGPLPVQRLRPDPDGDPRLGAGRLTMIAPPAVATATATEVASVARLVAAAGLAEGFGHVSARLPGGGFAITSTAPLGFADEGSVIALSGAGRRRRAA